MSSMKWAFSDIYGKVIDFLGMDSTTATDVTAAKDIVYRGYMKFLLPVSPKDEEIYIWSFLRQPWKLNFEPDKWEYPLPKDFERFFRTIEYDDRERIARMEQTTERKIMRSRNNLEFNSYPTEYAIRTAKFDKKVGSVKELICYPTPTARTIVNCTYVMTPDKPEATTDYFIGGPLESEVILQCCIAVAETQEDEKIGVETKRAVDMIQALIRKDKGIAADTVGMVHDAGIGRGSVFDYRSYWIPSGTYLVYGEEI
ncbi:hypothetical protein LCGC14_1348750 [marine sediment metagenome]|uniref:Uncharacterized protein n=1 Tax=marine sediment metagenome TaxID=412755 RepID=A0A0F9KC66_9ZZZZ